MDHLLIVTNLTTASLNDSGSGFALLDLPHPLGSTALAICMDLNPVGSGPYSLSTVPYELANFVRDNMCQTLILLCNWLDPGTRPELDWSVDTVNYWANRLWPLIEPDSEEIDDMRASTPGDGSDSDEDAVLVVICNRTGVEMGRFP